MTFGFDPKRFPGHRGIFPTTDNLPNVNGSLNADVNISEGDIGWVTDSGLYVCTDSTRGAAVWELVGAGGGGAAIITLYVDGTGGSDSNPGTLALPFQTLVPAAAAISKTPQDVHYVVRVLTSAAAYTVDSFLDRVWPTVVKSINIVGETILAGDSGTATGGSANTIVDSGAPFTADSEIGRFVEITNGARINVRRMIIQNTTTTLVLATDGPTDFIAGDDYQIFLPGVTLDSVAGGIFGGADSEDRRSSSLVGSEAFRLCNVFMAGDGGTATYQCLGNVEFYGVSVSTSGIIENLPRAGCSTPTDTGNLAAALGLASNDLWFGYGYDALQVSSGVLALPSGFMGIATAQRFTSLGGAGSSIRLLGGRVQIVEAQTGILTSMGDTWVLGGVGAHLVIEQNASLSPTAMTGIVASPGSSVELALNVALDVTAATTADGIQSLGNAVCDIAGAAAPVTVAASRYGARARFGGKIYVRDDTAGISGVTADLAAGETPITAATLAAIGNAVISTTPADASIVQRVA